jgi:hypothetical protein
MVIVLTRLDVFRRKIVERKGSFAKAFPDYKGPEDSVPDMIRFL